MFTQYQVKRICNILFVMLLLTAAVGIRPGPAQAAPDSAALGTAFTYQGQLKSGGNPVNGSCDFQFGLWDAESAGSPIGSTQTKTSVTVTNGLFTVSLDFGSSAFDGNSRWLAIAVRCPAGSGDFVPLAPRQPLTVAPYALYAKAAPWSGLTGVPVGFADGVDNIGWSLTGNSGTTPGTNFLGTTGNQALELRVNNGRVFRLEPNATSPNLIGGYSGNSVTSGVAGATIGGGGESSYTNRVTDDYGTVGGGRNNRAGDDAGTTSDKPYATVGGGVSNTASNDFATVGGGALNTASGSFATVGGGMSNTASGNSATVGGGALNTASGSIATVSGGMSNTASGSYATVGGGTANTANGNNSTVSGGLNNTAAGDYSFAAGRRAKANAQGAFVWADSTDADFTAGVANSFIVRASGGIYLGSGTSSTPSTRFIDTWTGAYLSDSGVWTDFSDRNAKANFAAVNGRDVLARLMAMPVSIWNYKVDDASIRHIGPTAQDFYSTFGVGSDDTHLAALDTNGVALAAIQGLYGIVQEKNARITALEARLSTLEQKNADLEARLAALEQRVGNTQPPVSASPAPWLALGGLVLLGVVAYRRRTNGGGQ